MKIRNHHFVVLAAVFFLSSFQAQAQSKCITREDQIHTSPAITDVVKKLGGVANLEGSWHLGGLAGVIKRVVISFKSEGDGLKGFVEGLDSIGSGQSWAALTICETSRADTVMILIQGEKDYIFMTPSSVRAMYIAEVSNGKAGSYYLFNKK